MDERERKKALDEKVKRFDRKFLEVLTNIVISVITTIILLAKLGLLR